MAIDRAEAIGLSVTVGGHGLILAALYFGIFGMEEKIEKPAALTVTLEGEGSPLPVTGEFGEASAAPEFVEEAESELEAAADEADDTADAAAKAEAEAARAAAAAKSANATAEEKRAAREAAAKAAKKRRDAEAARKKREKAERDRKRRAEEERKRREQAQKDFDGVGSKLGGANKPNAAATRKAKATIGGQIRIRGCPPPGLDFGLIRTTVTINLNKNGGVSSLTRVSQKGRTASNAKQMAPVKSCVLNSIRASAPFRGLNVDDYESWKSIRITFKAD